MLDANEGREACLAVVEPEAVEVVAIFESRFFASATAPVAPVLVAVRVVPAGPVLVGLVELVDLARVGVDFGAAVLLVEEAGFRAAAVVDAVVPTALALPGDEVVLGAVEVRRAVLDALEAGVRFFSSSDTDGWLRCDVVEADVGGRLATVEPGGGRVGGLLSPPPVRVAELASVGLVPVVPAVAVPRRAGTADVVGARFVALVLEGEGFEGEGFEGGGFEGDDFVGEGFEALVGAAGSGAGAGASSRWMTSEATVSDMLGYASIRVQVL